MKRIVCFGVISILLSPILHAASIVIDDRQPTDHDVRLGFADILIDPADATVVRTTADLLADDLNAVTGRKPAVTNSTADLHENAIVAGTIGQSKWIDELVTSKKLDVSTVKDQWESFGWQTVENPWPNVRRALVIFGADRRGTAYGILELSNQAGVSPWYWWADVPVSKHTTLRATDGSTIEWSPGVKYRGIFLNDEDWGMRPWATKTFDPQTGAMGPKTYAKIFELMLRLRMNFIWGAMHPGGTEFTMYPGNAACADRFAIVTGSSHCEPMLRNNVYWPKTSGVWQYDINRDNIFAYWKEAATALGQYESVWTLGIRGIHDAAMQGPPGTPARVKMLEQIFGDQRRLVDQLVTKKFGKPAECFIPYKEVLPLYQAGLPVPDDVTIVWPDDNFGYIRRLADDAERKRPGGTGVYYHVSYWGRPHSYLWVESTSPGLVWEELRKAYDNDSKSLWILNVGDLKPSEAAIDFYSRLAWSPSIFGPDAQNVFLKSFVESTFSPTDVDAVTALLNQYYQLAAVRKPEFISYEWAAGLSSGDRAVMKQRYETLLVSLQSVEKLIPPERQNAFFEMFGFATRVLSDTGLLYLDDPAQMQHWKDDIDRQTSRYNDQIVDGKWKLMMGETMEGLAWPTAVGGKLKRPTTLPAPAADKHEIVIDAASGQTVSGKKYQWQPVAGLGWSGQAMTVVPAIPGSPDDLRGASITIPFTTEAVTDHSTITIDVLPTIRLVQGSHLRIGVAIDDQATSAIYDVPGGEADGESAKERRDAVLSNRQMIRVEVPILAAGKHQLRIDAVDPGVVVDQIELPQ